MSILTGSKNNDTCVLPIVDLISNTNKKAKISAHNLFYSNNTTVGSLSSYDNYFGTGADGNCTVSSSAQISSSTSPAGLNNISREFGNTIVKNFQNLTINSGVLFSPLRACRGMVIYCSGNLTVNGTLSMTGKGGGVVTKIAAPIGIAPSTDSRYDLVDATLYFNNFSSSIGGKGIPTHWNWAPSGSAWFSNYKTRIAIISGSVAGGTGATGNPSPAVAATVGSAGIFCCGGGGGGGAGTSPGIFGPGAAGGRGTIFAGGGGGGGGNAFPPGAAAGSVGLLEAGGSGGGGNSAGGAGNPAGSGVNSGGATSGLLILIVRGNITINGTVSSNGGQGGNGAAAPGGTGGGGGGGSGGGRIVIIYGGTYSNAGSVVANGGSGGTGGPTPSVGGNVNGAAGGAGAITVRRVHV